MPTQAFVLSDLDHSPASNKDNRSLPYGLNPAYVKIDLLNERPQWILSSYGPGKDAPTQLFGGFPREQSFEEMRLRHYQLAAQGKQQDALNEAQSLYENAENQIIQALQDIEGAIKYVLDGETQHPNRIDTCLAKGSESQTVSGAATSSPFSQPSDFTRSTSSPSPFASASSGNSGGQNPFGQSTFGQQSTFNRPGGSFGQPSFQTSVPPAQSGFGQPSMLGRTSQAFQATPEQPQTTTSRFSGNPFAAQQPTAPANPFARTANTEVSVPQSTFSNSTAIQHTSSTAQMRKDAQGKLQSWNGMAVLYEDGNPFYRNPQGQLRRIWFPDGSPALASLESLPDTVYSTDIENEYAFFKAEGYFRDGIVPSIAPKKEWCDWNM